MDLFLQWLNEEVEKLRVDPGMLSERGKTYKEVLQLVQKKYASIKEQNIKRSKWTDSINKIKEV